jgi:hypothetical protein
MKTNHAICSLAVWHPCAMLLIGLFSLPVVAQESASSASKFPASPFRKVSSPAGPVQQAVPAAPAPEDLPAGFPTAAELYRQTDEDVRAKSWGCINCHQGVGDMHDKETVKLGCIDCHGGNANCDTKEAAHVWPKFPDAWTSSANPVRSYTLLNHEDPAFIRFVNPGDLRVAKISCGQCHPKEVLAVQKGMMTHGCMLWGAALYNNGSVPHKRPRFGESYSMNGVPQRINNVWTEEEWSDHERDVHYRGMVPYLLPLPRFEVSQPGNILRIFEPGGRFRPEVGIPERGEEPGRPRARLSNRGLGTENRTDPVLISLAKTRLLDPTLNFLGSNDHPGDFRSSGCTACHVVYANDRSGIHSGPYAKHGNLGLAAFELDPPGPQQYVKNIDPTIPKNESGHPIAHKFTSAIPTSQCIVCHIHPGTNVLNSYLGYMWWDYETDGELMYPEEQKYPTSEEVANAQMANPEEGAIRGNWSDPQFLNNLTDLNTTTKHTQFADFHGHGWAFRAVFKKNREGFLLDHKGDVVQTLSNEKLREAVRQPTEQEREMGKALDDHPVHLLDIHLERGMHCIDCHFNQDVHGNTKLYGEVRAAIEITCIDCHGTAAQSVPAMLSSQVQAGKPLHMPTTGPAAPPPVPKSPVREAHPGGHNLLALKTPFGKPRFEWQPRTRELIQHSMVHEGRSWKVIQTADSITPGHPSYNPRSHQAKTVRWNDLGEMVWGGVPNSQDVVDEQCVAHQNNNISCVACHSSWNPSCFGCHLPQKANKKMPDLHNEGDVSRNLVSYNFQTLRDDVYMLARDGFATGNKINPARSSCAIHVTSYNANRETIYTQQQTISADGFSGIAFSTNVPHTVRGGSRGIGSMVGGTSETKQCTDCHLSKQNDNNAIMAQLLMQGTNFVNFIGRYCWVAAGEHGFEAVVVTERDEPQTVIGSTMHQRVYPDFYEEHLKHDRKLKHAHEHPGKDISEQVLRPFQKNEVLSLLARGEYLYAACGKGGLRVFDIAFIDHKGFSERVTTAPVSPLGQRFYVPSTYATCVAAPTTIAPDPTRKQLPENHEGKVHALYGYIYFTDSAEGLILVGAGTLLDGNPVNNFLEREVTFNPDGLLKGARYVTIVGTYAYVLCDAGWVIIDIDDPKHPLVKSVVGKDVLHEPTSVQVQFRYAFVTDHEGVKVFDVTDLASPVYKSQVPLEDAHSIYVARTYAYVAAGKNGLVILNVANPEEPYIDQVYTADGCINDLHDVKLGITYTSEFAYLADGENGLRVVQLTSPDTPGSAGFSPRPYPQLIATYKLPKEGHALAISKGIDRDRAVDEAGNQIAVFGRIGARPLNRDEQRRMYLRTDPTRHNGLTGMPWFVSDDPFDKSLYRWPANLPQWKDLPARGTQKIYGPLPTPPKVTR